MFLSLRLLDLIICFQWTLFAFEVKQTDLLHCLWLWLLVQFNMLDVLLWFEFLLFPQIQIGNLTWKIWTYRLIIQPHCKELFEFTNLRFNERIKTRIKQVLASHCHVEAGFFHSSFSTWYSLVITSRISLLVYIIKGAVNLLWLRHGNQGSLIPNSLHENRE